MAHLEKYQKGSVGHLCEHYERTSKTPTENIDKSKSNLNYNLAQVEHNKKSMDFIHQRLSEVKVQKRKDVNIMCDWVVTAPTDLPLDEHRQFFQATYDFLAEKYGRNNVISAYVHNDEQQPHLHFAFIPVVPDKKKGGFKVSAKECITLKDLKCFHNDLTDFVEQRLGHTVGILNQATREGNKSIDELKRGTALAKQRKLEAETQKLAEKIEPLQKLTVEIDDVKKKGRTVLPGIVIVKKKDMLVLKEQAAAYAANRDEIDNARKRAEELKQRAAELNRREDTIEDDEKDIGHQRYEVMLQEEAVQKEIQKQLNLNNLYEQSQRELNDTQTHIEALKRENASLKRENASLRLEIENVKGTVDEKLKAITERFRGSVERLATVCKAIKLLKCDSTEDYKAQLTPRQVRLIDGISKYCAKYTRSIGEDSVTFDIENRIGLSNGISNEIKALEQKSKHRFDMDR